jgi:hypothetical protein
MRKSGRRSGGRRGARCWGAVALLAMAGCEDAPRLDDTDVEAEEPTHPTFGHAPDGASILEGWGTQPAGLPTGADPLFAEGSVHRIDLSLDEAARSSLRKDPDLDVPATVRYGDQSWNVGLQLKGSYSFRSLAEKASFKIDFEEFVPDQRFFGLRRITLNAMVQDASMLREHEVYWMYARLGVPAPRHGYAEVWVDGEPYGLYGLLETLDGTWAERVFPGDSEGPLYEGGYGTDVEEGDALRFDMQRQGDLVEPWSDLTALTEELEATPPEAYLAWLERRFDAPALFRMWALDLVSGHRDGYVKRKNNFLVYHGLESDRWWMIPWGQDQALRDGLDVHSGYSGHLAERCAEVPECQERLDLAIRYVATMWEAWDLYGHATATSAAVTPACERDPRKELLCSDSSVLEMILERPDEVWISLQ